MITGAAFETGFQLSVVTLLLTASFFFCQWQSYAGGRDLMCHTT